MSDVAQILETVIQDDPQVAGKLLPMGNLLVVEIYTGFCMMELTQAGTRGAAYLNGDALDFREGKLHPRTAPGPGIEFDPSNCEKMLEVTEGLGERPGSVFRRPDGSYTNW